MRKACSQNAKGALAHLSAFGLSVVDPSGRQRREEHPQESTRTHLCRPVQSRGKDRVEAPRFIAGEQSPLTPPASIMLVKKSAIE